MTITQLNELKQKRAQLIADARKLSEKAETENRSLTAEEDQTFAEYLADADAEKAKIEREEKLLGLEDGLVQIPGRRNRDEPGDAGETREQKQKRDDEETRQLYRNFLRSGRTEMEIGGERRALQADSDQAGGYLLAPEVMVTEIIKAADDDVFLRQFGTVLPPLTGTGTLGAASLDADPADADWTDELNVGTEDTTMDFGKRSLTPKPLAKLIKISKDLLKLSPRPEQIVNERLGYKFSITEEKGYLTGSGSGQPLGVFTASSDGISTARDVSLHNSTTAIAADNLRAVKYNLKAPYRRESRWLFHRDAIEAISKLKDSDNQYLWQPGIRAGDPDSLLGLPLDESEYVPNTFTTGLYVGILAAFRWYWIADVAQFEIQRLVELYAGANQVGFIGRKHTDGMPVLPDAFARVTLA